MYKNPSDMSNVRGNRYFRHYYKYLQLIALQLIEWKNLPPGVDARFLEMVLHGQGQVVIGYTDPKNLGRGYFAASGSEYGQLDIYGQPQQFRCIFPYGEGDILNLHTYLDDNNTKDKNGVLIYNNDFRQPTYPDLRHFANDLAHIKQVQKINVNNQKTPYFVVGTEKQLLNMKKTFHQMDGDADRIFIDPKIGDINNIIVHSTPAPYVTDKLGEHFMSVWGEVMTFLGVEGLAIQKKERLVVDEANANNEQNRVSENIYLKTRQEACEKMNQLWGTNIEVCIRAEAVEMINQQIEKEGEFNV